MEITIKVTGLDGIAAAINNLAAVLAQEQRAGTPAPQEPQQQPVQQQPAAGRAPALQSMPVQQQVAADYTARQPAQQQAPFQQTVTQQQAPFQQTVTQQQAPFQQAVTQRQAPFQQALPTTAVTQDYTQDQLAVAMTALVDQGKQPLVMQLLSQLGAGSLLEIPKEQYPALATKLRELGANI